MHLDVSLDLSLYKILYKLLYDHDCCMIMMHLDISSKSVFKVTSPAKLPYDISKYISLLCVHLSLYCFRFFFSHNYVSCKVICTKFSLRTIYHETPVRIRYKQKCLRELKFAVNWDRYSLLEQMIAILGLG